jgi:phosphatidate cytidylyltransferase
MAFNWTTFWARTWTALVFVAIMAIGLLYNEWSFFILISIIHFGCWWEFLKLGEKIYTTKFHVYSKLGIALIGFHILLLFCNQLFIGTYNVKDNFSLPFLIAGIVFLIWGIFKTKVIKTKQFLFLCSGLLYISLSLALFMHIRFSNNLDSIGNIHNDSRYFLPALIIAAIWINDTMAYLVGSAIGRTHFSKASPKKTLEGTLGGMLLCVLAITFILKPYFQWQALLGISLCVAVFGTLGDLLESKIKRTAGVKDSGHIMPGHGGFLDRFDSLLIAIPVVWLFLNIYNLLK